MIKGIYNLFINDDVPRTHNIEMLANLIEDSAEIIFDEHKYELFRTLSKYYLADRYPDFMSDFGALVEKEEAERLLLEAKEVFSWLLTLKPSKD